jgi:uncharacterized protein YqfB (UPF0267 family)
MYLFLHTFNFSRLLQLILFSETKKCKFLENLKTQTILLERISLMPARHCRQEKSKLCSLKKKIKRIVTTNEQNILFSYL